MNKKSIAALAVCIGLGAGSTFAAGAEWVTMPSSSDAMMVTEAKIAADSSYIPPHYGATYKFDQEATRKSAEATSALLRLKCNPTQALASFGFSANADKVVSLGVLDNGHEYNFDFRSCSMRINRSNADWNNLKSLTETDALAKARDFVASAFLQSKIYNKLGSARVIAKHNNRYPMPYYDVKEQAANGVDEDLRDIVIVPDAGPDTVEREFTNYSILFPYMIGGKMIYNQYGQPAGVTVEVSSDGVMSSNVQLLPFVASTKDSDKMSADDRVAFVQRGGNNPFRGASQELTLKGPERVFVLFNLWRNNQTELYISSGIKFSSDVKPDIYSQQNYEMIVSDYKIGNNYY